MDAGVRRPRGHGPAVGLAVIGWTVLRSGVLPTWAGIALLAGALLMLGANEQTSLVLLVIPFGLAWAATGLRLLLRRPSVTARPPSPLERPA